ncbi:replicative DNA helicase [Williamsoniiplasma lucivorax]|uniref:Replicative DNA helicase n=1 Tax=Williamsoniiplasma lucivorax TaxID=209274 RepID=A0A2S5REZ9_9MOLU|nr:replicative DNA helicase [Williamsoniiplasma lucivorax]PPE05868.1 replicative DNA helicase [Williamsoniiplasma lucivorax]
MDKILIEKENANLSEAEQAILAIAMHSPNALPDIFSALTTDDFFVSTHKLIYKAITDLHANSKEISPITITDELETQKKLDQAGGVELISEISDKFVTDSDLESMIAIVYKKSIGRKFEQKLKSIEKERLANPDLEYVINKAQTELLSLDLSSNKNNVEAIGTTMEKVLKKMRELEKQTETLLGVPSGFQNLDEMTLGFQPGDLIILAARPSMGKTAFALNLAYNAGISKKNNKKNGIAIFSIEMPKEQLTNRILSMSSQIDYKKLQKGKNISQFEWDNIHKTNDRLQTTKIFIDDTPGITIQQIQSRLHKLKRDEDINLCVIDYLQLITTPGSNGSDRQNEISNISRQLKRIARDIGIPIICLSQLSRSVEKREDKRPMLSDLRDSGAIEQDADMVMFLYREEYYDTQKEFNDKKMQDTELIIAKHRNGPTGNVKLSFNLQFGKFIDLTN